MLRCVSAVGVVTYESAVKDGSFDVKSEKSSRMPRAGGQLRRRGSTTFDCASFAASSSALDAGCEVGRHQKKVALVLLMPSTPSVHPQVASRCFPSVASSFFAFPQLSMRLKALSRW